MNKKCFVKEASVLLILVLMLSSVGVMAANTQFQTSGSFVVEAYGTTWYVPDDFPTIQEAIDSESVNDGDTIYVRSGTYYEDIDVDKSIKLIGENKETTIIDADGENYAVDLIVDSVTISGFTIRDSTIAGIGAHNSGFDPPFTDQNTITDNIITNNENGILLYQTEFNTITGNTITDNHVYGIWLSWTEFNTITGNTITDNGYYGIRLFYSSDNIIGGDTDDLKNNIEDHSIGIYIEGCLYYKVTLMKNNIFEGNTVNIWGAIPKVDQSSQQFSQFSSSLFFQIFQILQRLLNIR